MGGASRFHPRKLLWPLAALLAGAVATPAMAIEYLNVTVQADRAMPTACFSFSTPLPRDGRTFEPFVTIAPGTDHALQAQGKDLCVTGLQRRNSNSLGVVT